MTNAELGQAIDVLALASEKKTTSVTVKANMVAIRGLTAQLLPAGVTVNERRKPNSERRQKDSQGSPMLRIGGRRGGGAIVTPDPGSTVETLDITSSAPVNFEPPATHQLVAVAKNRAGATLDNVTISYATSDALIATVSATGLVTAVGTGTAVITASISTPSKLSKSSSYNVTTPQATPNNILLSASTMNVTVNTVATSPSATVRDASNQTLTGQTVTWSEVSGLGDVTLSADSATDAHTTQVTGITAGTRVIRATCGVLTADITVTVDAVPVGDGVTDALGILHPNLPAGYTAIRARLYGTTKAFDNNPAGTPTGAVKVTGAAPYYKNYTEGWDPAKDNIPITTDPTVPFQSQRETVYTGLGYSTNCGWMRLNAGAAGNNGFAQTGTFPTTTTNRYTDVSPSVNQQWRSLYWHRVFKFQADFPSHRLNKMGFVGMGSEDNMMFLMVDNGQTGLTSTPLTPLQWTLQGTKDNALIAVPGDRSGAINATWGPGARAGSTRSQDVTGGVAYTFTRGVWYSLEMLIHVDTFGSDDGYGKFWLASWDGTAWSTPVAVFSTNGATGLHLTQATAGGQTYFRSIQHTYQNQSTFPGTGRFAISSNFNIVSTLDVPYQINGVNYTLPAGTVCTVTGKTITASQWGAFQIVANAAGVLDCIWAPNPGYAAASGAVGGIGNTIATTTTAEVGYVSVLAPAQGWTAGTDALQGGTGGNPATTTNYNHRSGVLVAMEYWAMSTS